ncbi:MAG: hypothetical protein MJK04_37510 [Psychrosphaera sp.]|nr:hypothetical protein [Psychrosphaera sp.]
MKNLTKCIKTVALGTLFASSALLSTAVTAIEGGDNGEITQYMSTWSGVLNLCGQTYVTCLNTRASGSGWYVTWK